MNNETLLNRINSILSMAITSSNTTETPIQTVQLEGMADEVLDGVEHVGTYGIASSVPKGAQAIVGFIGGNRDFPFVLALGHNEHRPTDLEVGESALYSKFGNEVRLNAAGELVFNSGEDYAVKYSELETQFDELQGKFNDLVQAFNSHVHATAAVGPPVTPTPVPTKIPAAVSTADIKTTKVEKVRI